MITAADFKGLYFIDTSRDDTVDYLNDIIEQCYAKYGVDNKDTSKDEMMLLFAYYEYNMAVITSSSPIGEVLMSSENSQVVMNFNKLITAYNDAVDLYNVDAETKLSYINSLGI